MTSSNALPSDYLKPIEGAKVELYIEVWPIGSVSSQAVAPPPHIHHYITYTDENGRYTIRGVDPGWYTIRVSKTGYKTVKDYLRIYSGDNIEKIFTLKKIVNGEIVKVDKSYDNKEIYLEMGQHLNLTLVTNPSTGYKWEFVDFNKSKMKIIDHFYWGYPHHDPPISGAPCNETWIMKPLKSCDFRLKLKYYRPWEPNSTIDMFNLTIHIIDLDVELEFSDYQGSGVPVYPEGGPVNVSVTIRNIGNVSALVSDPSLLFCSLEIYIGTPSHRTVEYIGPFATTWPGSILLQPKSGRTVNISISPEYFGFKGGTHYNFTEHGNHTIQVKYISWGRGDNRWQGSISSGFYTFLIASTD